RECLVRFCHTVYVFTLLDRRALAFGGVHDLASETASHVLFATLACGVNQPAHGQRGTTARAHFYRHLVGSTTYTAGFHLNHGTNGIQRAFEQLQRVAGLLALLDDAQRAIDDTLGDRLLAGLHYMVDELGQDLALEFRIWKDFSLRSNATSWHRMFPLNSPPGGRDVFRVSGTTTMAARPYSSCRKLSCGRLNCQTPDSLKGYRASVKALLQLTFSGAWRRTWSDAADGR